MRSRYAAAFAAGPGSSERAELCRDLGRTWHALSVHHAKMMRHAERPWTNRERVRLVRGIGALAEDCGHTPDECLAELTRMRRGVR